MSIGEGSTGEFAIGEGPEDYRDRRELDRGGGQTKRAPINAQINPTGLSDLPAKQDAIGFKPYVRAISWFLSSDQTKPPLTISIEGPWGSGKSSFMLQLEEELKSQSSGARQQFYVRFNAWRSDKEEALWAAFALTFIKQLERNIDFCPRIKANFKLAWKRFEWKRSWIDVARIILFLIAFLVLTIFALNHPPTSSVSTNAALVTLPWLAAMYFAIEKAKKIFGNPLSYDLSKFVRNLKYEDKVAFIDRFHEDFTDIVRSYVGQDGRVFVFIDDLDRCEIPRAAELLQAINLLLSADTGNLFFILGLDREMVAAGIAAKNEKILPYMAAGRAGSTNEKEEIHRLGIDYGYNFMEKFVQVPFQVPRADEREIARWVSEFTASVENQLPINANLVEKTDWIRAGADPEGFQDVVKNIARVFGFNPRRLKQFVNVFRLRVMIALSTKILTPAPNVAGGGAKPAVLTIQRLGLFTAILMRWSRLAGDLVQEPMLLHNLLSDDGSMSAIKSRWIDDQALRKTIEIDATYSLRGVDLKPLLMIMPDEYPGSLGVRDATQGITRLVAGLGSNISEGTSTIVSSESFTNASVDSVTSTGATGSIASITF